MTIILCKFYNCEKPAKTTGLCSGHYVQKRKGQELKPLRSRASNGTRSGWYIGPKGYVIRHLAHGKGITSMEYQHRTVMEEHLKRKLYKGENVHHINGDKTDNRIENLELWDKSQPAGQRLEQKIEYAISLLEKHGYTVIQKGNP